MDVSKDKNNSKPNHITSASLIDLKAELIRKQDQLKNDKNVGKIIHPQKKGKKETIWTKKNKGVEARASKDAIHKLNEEEVNMLERSRKTLEAKAKIYDDLSKKIDSEGASDIFLVDFEQKALDDINSRKKLQEAESDSIITNELLPDAKTPDEEWVEFIDSFGRTRCCMRKDLDSFKRLDQSAMNTNDDSINIEMNKQQLTPDEIYRQQLHAKWEKQDNIKQNQSGPIHYEDVRYDEKRSHGVGYFQFSTDENQRKEQIDTLNELRQQTVSQREKRENMKMKRKALLDARLAKVKMRKRISEGVDPNELEDETEEKDNVLASSKSDIGPQLPSVKEIEEVISAKLKKAAAPVREWDKGKIGTSGFWQPAANSTNSDDSFSKKSFNNWKDKLRNERDNDFAPPKSYEPKNSKKYTEKNQDMGTRQYSNIPPPSNY